MAARHQAKRGGVSGDGVNWAWPPRGVSAQAIRSADTICREMKRRGNPDACSCAFSGGKDSVVMLWVLRHYFETVYPVYWFLVPGLGFVNRALAAYERLLGVRVSQLPHPDRHDMIAKWTFQPPSRLSALEAIYEEVDDYTMDGLWAEAKTAMRLPADMCHATGIRASDSPTRAGLYRKHGGFSPNGKTCYPVITWKLDDVEACLDHARLQLPPEYAFIGRSFDGIMRRYTHVIREQWPEDWAKILADFPLADLEFFRAEQVVKDPPPLYKFVGGGEGR